MPPIQCVKLLQNKIQRGRASTSLKMLAPVVVNPETVSNRASTGFVMDPLNRKGREPITLSTIQLRETETNPSFV